MDQDNTNNTNREYKQDINNNITAVSKPVSRPNESAGIYYSSMVKITDPNTGEVLVHIRGD